MKKIEKRQDGSIAVKTINSEPSRTQQQFKAQVDINNIMKKYKKTGDMSIFIKSGKGRYGDFSNVADYQTALNKVIETQDSFQSLPPEVRIKFANDPGQLLEFINDNKNYDEAVKLGLVEPKPPKTQSTETSKSTT